ncbi:MAG TPA: SdiA-regulated domain-containing protein [Verrucomicrobiales bacterium]|jgi:hypothetical protein|nr:SdiA-regulated domain-containing protein [Verrucomicrobiales bacterium]
MKSALLRLSPALLLAIAGLTLADSNESGRRALSSWGSSGSIIVDDIPDSGPELGSGVEYWPEEEVFLVVNNNTRELRRVTTAGALTGKRIALKNFWDPEEIRLIDPATHLFAISQEFRAARMPNEIVVITIPPGASAVDREDAVRILRPALTQGEDTEIGANINKGYEAMAYKDGQFYFCLEKQSTSEGTTPSFWNVWSVPNEGGGGTVPVTAAATLRFPLPPILTGKATDVASMCFTPWGTLMLGCHEGAGVPPGNPFMQAGRLIEVTLRGQLVEDTPPPVLNNGRHMRQLEGICFRTATTANPLQFVLTGEPCGTAGTDWMVLQ